MSKKLLIEYGAVRSVLSSDRNVINLRRTNTTLHRVSLHKMLEDSLNYLLEAPVIAPYDQDVSNSAA